jgi:hypothetical protein
MVIKLVLDSETSNRSFLQGVRNKVTYKQILLCKSRFVVDGLGERVFAKRRMFLAN